VLCARLCQLIGRFVKENVCTASKQPAPDIQGGLLVDYNRLSERFFLSDRFNAFPPRYQIRGHKHQAQGRQ
jgi:hypothetical protein